MSHSPTLHAHPDHATLQPRAPSQQTMVYTATEKDAAGNLITWDVTVVWTWTGSREVGDYGFEQSYDLEITGATGRKGLSLVSLGLQGSHNDISVTGHEGVLFGKQSNQPEPSGDHIAWVSPPNNREFLIPGCGMTRRHIFGGGFILKEKNIMFLKASDPSVGVISLSLKTTNTRWVQPRNKHEPRLGHENVPPPFPPGSGEGD